MEKQILEILKGIKELQTDMKVVQTDMKEVKTDLVEVKTDLVEVKSDIREIKGTVNRIETAQAEDVVGILKMTKKKTDFEVDYINNRLTEMDKRLFNIEKRIEN
ncbi:septal ring factor EnvC (AmiA/AmiB activator) [Bacillus sp. SLBN-46]|uniref:hypothetical protein n=1 Tax=Bacillus sp. SLBN-46 TaxID=3042283 RepID=UPI00286042EF|nr:hypothetical protein [Bacillus sp. SLBN-46]MDR6123450.1 septal ring factor EnvC (AmiA/AmiB activator) [Bacillus sp. SLBN-46]